MDELTIKQKRLILEAGFDSDRLRLLELNHPELCIYTLDSVKFDQIWREVIEHDQQWERGEDD